MRGTARLEPTAPAPGHRLATSDGEQMGRHSATAGPIQFHNALAPVPSVASRYIGSSRSPLLPMELGRQVPAPVIGMQQRDHIGHSADRPLGPSAETSFRQLTEKGVFAAPVHARSNGEDTEWRTRHATWRSRVRPITAPAHLRHGADDGIREVVASALYRRFSPE